MNQIKLIIAFVMIGFGGLSAQESDLPVYDAPDQAVWDPSSRSWYVSNLGGGISLERDGYGWIVKLDETGKVIDPRWVENLDAPSGMVVAGNLLYVVDRDGLYEIDIATAVINHFYKVTDPQFLNDVALGPDGKLYVSDFSAQRIYRVDPVRKNVEIFIESEKLDTPDDLYANADASTTVLTGPRNVAQLRQNVNAVGDGALPNDIMERIDEIAAMVPFRPYEEPFGCPFRRDDFDLVKRPGRANR